MTKAQYREYFANVKQFIKLNKVCKIAGIKQTNLSNFMKGYDYSLSIEKLRLLEDAVNTIFEKIA